MWLGKWFLCFKQPWCLSGTSWPFKIKALHNCTMWGTTTHPTQHIIPYDAQSSETKLWEPQTLYTAINKRIIRESQFANDVDINGHGIICDNLPWGCINPRYQVTVVTVAHNNLWNLRMELAAWHHAGTENSEVSSRFLENLWTPALQAYAWEEDLNKSVRLADVWDKTWN